MNEDQKYIFDFLVELSFNITEYQKTYPHKKIKEVAVDTNHYNRIKESGFVWIVDLEDSLYFLGTKIVKAPQFVGTFTSIRSENYSNRTADA